VKPLKHLKSSKSGKKVQSSGGGATTVIRSAARRRSGPLKFMSRHPEERAGGEQIPSIGSEHVDQQSLDPEVSARDLNFESAQESRTCEVPKFRSSRTIHRQGDRWKQIGKEAS
jgi:hypothetical protein